MREELGANFLYATELVSHTQDDEGVTATVRNVDDGSEQLIRARYMVACDGNRSPIRQSLGIDVVGHGLLSRSVTIYFRADCSEALRGRNLGVIYVTNPQVRGFFRLEKTGLGGFLVVFTVGDIHEPGARFVADTITDEIATDLVRIAVGDPDLDVDVQAVDKWRAVAEAATTFSAVECFSPATLRTPCHRPAGSEGTPAFGMRTTSPGSSPTCFAETPAKRFSTRTTASASRLVP